MQQRHRKILSFLLNNEKYVTGNELSRLVGVSLRTIRDDIKMINDLILDYDIKINAKVKKGYYFKTEDKDVIKQVGLIKNLIDNEYINSIPASPYERQTTILLTLCKNDYSLISELAYEFMVSESTIKNDVNEVKKWLKTKLNEHLKISNLDKINIRRDESLKRNIISWVLDYKFNAGTLEKGMKLLFNNNTYSVYDKSLFKMIDQLTKKHGYFLSGHSSQTFAHDIYVSYNRFNLGFLIDENTLDSNCELLDITIQVKIETEKIFGYSISVYEWKYIEQKFLSKQFLKQTDLITFFNKDISTVITLLLSKFKKNYKLDFTSNDEIIKLFVLYLSPMINRLKNNYCISNSVNIDGKLKMEVFEELLLNDITEIIKLEYGLKVNSDELYYLKILLLSIQSYWIKKKNIVIVCDYDQSIIDWIKNTLLENFSSKIQIVENYTYQQFKFFSEKEFYYLSNQIDLLITTSSLANITNLDFLQINPIMSDKEKQKFLTSFSKKI